jgi:hypothetical protein
VTRLNREIELLQHSKTSTSTQLEAERSEVAALERRLAAHEAAAKREKSRWGEEKKEVSDSPHACRKQWLVVYIIYAHCRTSAVMCSGVEHAKLGSLEVHDNGCSAVKLLAIAYTPYY